ncbi:MAG: tRNA (guanosine(46)-N7)-methyltransferase TrmB [Bdellovibrionales bacterium]|nr:tRNA (guanosine(46)-N7)-methyltransferase TrmB [Bdellovibrionales bacterium]
MNWKNQYIDLIHTLPTYILSIERDEEISRARDALRKRCDKGVVVEIGSGSGHHLIELAASNPDTLCVGFEIRYKRTFRTAEKAQERRLQNLIVVRGSAELIPQLFEGILLDGVFINFPDPWSKRRWRKHRIMNREYLLRLCQSLRSHGFVSYKTDHREYFLTTLDLMKGLNCFELVEATEDLYQSDFLERNIQTEFEQLFLSKGLPVHYLKCLKVSEPGNELQST